MAELRVSGPEIEANDKAVVEEYVELIENEQKDWAKEGPEGLPGKMGSPANRLQHYMNCTLQEEMPMILDPKYLLKVSLGAYPPPFMFCNAPTNETVDAIGQPVMLPQPMFCGLELGHEAQGMMHQPMLETPWVNGWGLLIQLGQFKSGFSLFKHHADDFRRLLNNLGNRVGAS